MADTLITRKKIASLAMYLEGWEVNLNAGLSSPLLTRLTEAPKFPVSIAGTFFIAPGRLQPILRLIGEFQVDQVGFSILFTLECPIGPFIEIDFSRRTGRG
jgi:hypothetical protein